MLVLPDLRKENEKDIYEWYKTRKINNFVHCAVITDEGYVYGKTKRARMIAPLPWLTVRSNGKSFRALIDTGASINLISYDRIHEFEYTEATKYNVSLVGVDGRFSRLSEWINVTLTMPNGERIIVPMLCGLDSRLGMILGMPFLMQMRAKIDINERMLMTKHGTYGYGINGIPTIVQEKSGSRTCIEDVPAMTVVDIETQKIDEVLKSTALSEVGLAHARSVLTEFAEVWQDSLGTSSFYSHQFVLTDPRPIALPPRVIAERFHNEIEKQETEMLEKDVIEPSSSPYRFWPVIVEKQGGTYRFAIDYRRLNQVTVPDRYPMPKIEDLFHAIKDSEYFTLLDLASGFWQIPLDPDQRHYTAFSTHRGHWQFKRMPFGIINGPATFQRWMDQVLGDLRHRGVLVYIDDILIHHPTEAGMLKLFEEVMERLKNAGARMKISKCRIGPKSFEYLGHQVERGTRRPQRRKLMMYKQVKEPKNLKELRSILGALQYYRSYIPHMSEKVKPLTKLLQKDQPFIWTFTHSSIVHELLTALEEAVLLLAPSGNIFRLETDASLVALGGVLYDKEAYDRCKEGEKCLPIFFMSKTFTETQQRWSVNERELYAVLWCLENCAQLI